MSATKFLPYEIARNVSGAGLVKALRRLGDRATRQRGSHVRITTQTNGEHHEVIPQHTPIKAKTLSNILKGIAAHHGLSVSELLKQLEL